MEIECALIADEIWKQGPAVVNAEIRRIRETVSLGANSANIPPAPSPDVPPQKAAALEPEIRNGKLILRKSASASRLAGKSPAASLKALRGQMLDLANAVQNEAKIDRRVPARLREIAEKLPDRAPRQEALFEIGHAFEELLDYSSKANEQWPEVLASRYHAMVRAYDRTLRQFPKWVEFLNATPPRLAREQREALQGAASQVVDALHDSEVNAHIDPALKTALEAMGVALYAKSLSTSPFDEPMAAAYDALAHDVLESINNTLKPVAEKAVEVAGIASSAANGWGGEGAKTFVDEAKEQGKHDGRTMFQWTRRLLLSRATTGGMTLAHYLSGLYSEYFGWLIPLIAFLGTVTVSTAKDALKKRSQNKKK